MTFDLERIKAVLSEATAPDGPFSQRSLAAQAELQRDTVGDIIRGRNKNPTINVLMSLAEAMGRDLSVFGIVPGEQLGADAGLTQRALEQALDDAWEGRPRQRPAQIRYFAEIVLSVLELPENQPSKQDKQASGGADDVEADTPVRAATKRALS